ncbi:MAG: hypothetical protein KGL39_17210 [Patescibacteria group bacterium]|nr:hypothetical protein [Patescibacteria group bacterium]
MPDAALPDVEVLPGKAYSWVPGESLVGMPSADRDVHDALGVSKPDSVTGKLADIKRQEIEADKTAQAQIEKATAQIPDIKELSKTAGVEAEKLKPWDAEAEAAKRQTDPITAFGSIGSVFGILASAFTHAPMENALNASAAAMNAIKEGDKESYDRAAKAWEQNYKMALDRHKIEHQAFEDAVTLMKTNMEVGRNQMIMNAKRFGDQKAMVYLEAGMDKEYFELQATRQKLHNDAVLNHEKIVLANAELSRLHALGYDERNPESEKSQNAWMQYKKEQAEQKRAEHAVSLDKEWLATRTQELVEKEKMNPTDAYLQAEREQAQAKKSGLTGGQLVKQQEKEANVEATANQIDYAIDLIKEGRKTGDSVVGIKGAVGRALEWWRGTESSHDRFIAQIKQIQQQVKPLLTGSTRALFNAKDRADMDKIVAGLGYFTSEKQAMDVLTDLKKRLKHISLTEKEGSVPVPDRYKNEADGTEFPQKSTGRILVKKGNMLVPKD